MKYLSSSKRKFIRKVAREEYLLSCELFERKHASKKSWGSVKNKFILENSTRLISIRIRNSNEFNSIIGQILVSIAIKLAIRLVEKWIEDNIFTEEKLSQKFQQGEPGYVKEQ